MFPSGKFLALCVATFISCASAELTFLSTSQASDSSLRVTLSDGQLYGSRGTTVGSGNSYLSFRGIPYARPPVGSLRFTAPQKNEAWSSKGILDATQDRSGCIQGDSPVEGSEDCLFINVYTRSTSANLPVVVWIHGGFFKEGNSSYYLYGPDYILDENVVYVSLNYRLGLFGFLSTEDLVSPGNWGVKDLLLGLQWIQSNIARFGGNPSQVTIYGQSAGGTIASLLIQSSKASNLFQRAILQSGSSLNAWSLSKRSRELAVALATELGIDTSSSQSIVNGLRQASIESIQASSSLSQKLFLENPLHGLVVAPVIEPEHDGAILTEKSYNLLSTGRFNQVPTLLGITSSEAAKIAGASSVVKLYIASAFGLDRSYLAPYDINDNLSKRTSAGNSIKNNYFGLITPILLSSSSDIVEFINDDQFVRAPREVALQQSKYAPVWFYQFAYNGYLGNLGESRAGVAHSEDMTYIFVRSDLEINQQLVTQADRNARSVYVRLFANFVKYGDPTPSADALLNNVIWPQVSGDRSNLQYLNIGTTLSVLSNPQSTNMKFYDNLFTSYGDGTYGTY